MPLGLLFRKWAARGAWCILGLLLAMPVAVRAADFEEVTLQNIEFIRIPAGSFTMGVSDEAKADLKKQDLWTRFNDCERPAHQVTITKPFLIGKFEITQKQWRDISAKNKNPSAFKGDTLPVDSVSWDDVQAFIRDLNKRDKSNKFRLPTEAEWEYCARAGGNGVFGLGKDRQPVTFENLEEYAWFSDNADKKTQPVGKKKSNAWGLCDMSGNVWEWCQDWYDPGYYAKSPPTDPVNKDARTERVFRGGSWFLAPQNQRPASRGGNLPDFKSGYVGFRLVRDL